MTAIETTKVLAVLKATYPNFYRDMPDDEIDGIIGIWEEMFRDDDYQIVAAAVKALIAADAKGFPPVIGQVKARIRQITHPQEMTEGEAWALVHAAIRNSGYDSREEFDKLPRVIQHVVGGPSQLRDWSQMDIETVQSVVASNFQRAYRAKSQSIREYAVLPDDIKRLINADRMSIGNGM